MMYWLVGVAVLVLLCIYLDWRDKRNTKIPGPFALPLVGDLPRALWHLAHNTTLETQYKDFVKFGGNYQIMMGGRRIIFVSDTEDLKYFFQTNFNNYVKSDDSKQIFKDIFGDGIFNSDGESWQVQRHTASSLFHFNNLQDLAQIFKGRAVELSEVIYKTAVETATPVDLQQLFMRYTLDSIGEIGFGVNIGSLSGDPKPLQFANSFDYIQEASLRRFFNHPLWKYLPMKRFMENLKIVDDFMYDVIEDKRARIANGENLSNNVDLLYRFMLVKDEKGNPTFNKKYLLDVLKNFLIAGRDTTAVCLSWTLYLISQHPDVEQKLLAEIEEVVGKNSNGVTYANLADLKYMRQVIDESLRLYPPVPNDGRMAVNDDVLPSGRKVPAGATVSYVPYAQHRLEWYFPNPLSFNPDRWVTDHIKSFSFVPFHGGPRLCLGQNMAYQEIKVALCEILPRFSFSLVKGHVVTYKPSITLPMKNGLLMHVERRGK